jgi:HK97 family phage major capsid protein
LFFGNFFDGVMIGDRKRITMEMSREAGFIKDVTYLKIQSRYDINVHAGPGSSTNYGAYAGIITAAS